VSATSRDIFMTGKPRNVHAYKQERTAEYALQNSHTSFPHDDTKSDMLQITSIE